MAETDLDEYIERVKSLGLEVLDDRNRISGEGKLFCFYDYDNHLFELHTGTLDQLLEAYKQGVTILTRLANQQGNNRIFYKGKQMKIPTEKTYQNLIDFIDAAVESDELMEWLSKLEKLPDNLRSDHLVQMINKMESNKEPDTILNIVKSINNREILSAVNQVIKEVYESGMKTKKYLKINANKNFNVLVSLMAGI